MTDPDKLCNRCGLAKWHCKCRMSDADFDKLKAEINKRFAKTLDYLAKH